jgi:molybdate transport system ATP-binding protein
MSDPELGSLQVHLYQDHPIPLDTGFHCAAGELVALVGPSGSGKTTILRAIAGLYRPRLGKIICNGHIWLDTEARVNVSPQRRRVGLVFQDYALFPHLSTLDNVTSALGHRAGSERPIRARELLKLVHLEGLEQQRPAQLSGGQRQRVALARALAREPAVLLLDEPFSAVDQVTRRKLQRELVLLRRRINIPTLLVTHDLDEAAALADRICVLHRGRTLQQGPPLEVMRRPQSALVARLMDLSNVFEGSVLEHRPVTGMTLIRWLDYVLEARHAAEFPPGRQVSWVIPSSHIVLHRRGRPSRGERENPVRGRVGELVCLGENTTITMLVNEHQQYPLTFTISSHVARRNGLAPGEHLTVSLLAEGIHLMPWSSPEG